MNIFLRATPTAIVPRLVVKLNYQQSLRSFGATANGRAKHTAAEIATPLQERDNVRNILALAQQVRQSTNAAAVTPTDSLAPPPQVEQAQTRWWSTDSWANIVKAEGKQQTVRLATRKPTALSQELQEKLRKPKRMIQSNSSVALYFRSQPQVLEQYISAGGGVRMGRILEDLDSLAGTASYKHVLGARPTASDDKGSNPVFIVTASVDRLDLLEPLHSDCDYQLNGMVIYVGSSSMEVLVTMEDVSDVRDGTSDVGRAVLTGRFTMVARNAATGKAQSVPPLIVETEAEQNLFSQGQAHKQRKQLEAQISLEKVPPTSEEARLVHQLWLNEDQNKSKHTSAATSAVQEKEQAPSLPAVVHSVDTELKTVSHMHPQKRNVHFKIFGGYVMRCAYELAFMTVSVFGNGRPLRFLALDALSFHMPVNIGAMLEMTSRITYTSNSRPVDADILEDNAERQKEHCIASVVVLAELMDSSTGERKKSNTFHFSFDVGPSVKRVIPESYRDSIAFIEGKRRVDLGNELRRISHTA